MSYKVIFANKMGQTEFKTFYSKLMAESYASCVKSSYIEVIELTEEHKNKKTQ